MTYVDTTQILSTQAQAGIIVRILTTRDLLNTQYLTETTTTLHDTQERRNRRKPHRNQGFIYNSEAGVDTSVVSLFSDAGFVVLVCFCVISMFAIRYSMFSMLRISAVQIKRRSPEVLC